VALVRADDEELFARLRGGKELSQGDAQCLGDLVE
jgi:hypothetical protein